MSRSWHLPSTTWPSSYPTGELTRARNAAPSTIASYLNVGDNPLSWLAMRRDAHHRGARQHLEAFLPALAYRVSPGTGPPRTGDPAIADGTDAPASGARAAGRHPRR